VSANSGFRQWQGSPGGTRGPGIRSAVRAAMARRNAAPPPATLHAIRAGQTGRAARAERRTSAGRRPAIFNTLRAPSMMREMSMLSIHRMRVSGKSRFRRA